MGLESAESASGGGRPKLTFPGPRLYLCLMSVKRPAGLAIILISLLGLALASGSQEAPGQPAGTIRTFFTVRSSKADDTLPEEARKEFEDDDGRPLRAVAIDLNGDGKDEKFFLSGVPSKSGGIQWLVWDSAANAVRGLIVGSIIFVGRETDEGFPRLEAYWKQGGDMSVVFNYTFGRGKYARVNSRSLTVPEINEYFRSKPPIDLDKELAVIKTDHDALQKPVH
jgi:hypothetical protein